MGNNTTNVKNEISLVETNRINNPTQPSQPPRDSWIDWCCCCISNPPQQTQSWVQIITQNCNSIKSKYIWCANIITLLRSRQFSIQQHKQQVDKLYEIKNSINSTDDEIILTPSEMESFKDNLKSSVILSMANITLLRSFRQSSKNQQSYNHKNVMPNSRVNRGSSRIDNFRNSILMDHKPLNRSGKSMLRESLMSFVDDTVSNIFRSDKQVSKKNAQYLQILLNFTVMMQRHMSNPVNPLCLMKKMFVESFIQNYPLNKQWFSKINEQKVLSIVKETKQFLAILQEAMFNLYNLDKFEDQDNENSIITNYENLQTIVTAILFKDKTFYQHIFEIVKVYNNHRQKMFQKTIESNRGKRPIDFDIKDQYWLEQNENNKLDLQSKLQRIGLSESQSTAIPYYQCLQSLKQITNTHSPISKMKVIMQCSDKITESISKYYRQKNMEIKHWVLDADQVLSIFCYIIISAEVPNLHSHLFILQHFATEHQLISVTGYYYSVLMCALQQLQRSHEEKKLKK